MAIYDINGNVLYSSGVSDRSDQTWFVFGDSISQSPSDGLDKYYNYIANRTGLNVISYAVGGSGYYKGSSVNTSGNNNIIYQINNLPSNAVTPDIVSMMGGVNEAGLGVMGDIDDPASKTPTTLASAFKQCLDDAITKWSTATIFVILPPRSTRYNSISASNGLNVWCELQKNICRIYNIPCLDIQFDGGFIPYNADFAAKYYSDGTHLNADGHELLSYKIEEFMDKIHA